MVDLRDQPELRARLFAADQVARALDESGFMGTLHHYLTRTAHTHEKLSAFKRVSRALEDYREAVFEETGKDTSSHD